MSKNNTINIFHIGTQKAGSTFLYNLLAKHPDITLSKFTEINFFSNNYELGQDWYLDSFQGEKNRIDTSPKYFMTGETVAPRIKKYSETNGSKPLFLLILRNPIDYLYSHFQMHLTQGFFKKNPDKFPEVEKNIVKFIKKYPDYINRAMYSNLLKNYWLPYFNIEQFKIVSFEDLIKNQEEVMNEILSFWNIPNMSLTANRTSKNKMLRFKFLFKAQTFATKNKKIKDFLKSNKFFNLLYNNILTSKSIRKIEEEDRQFLKNIFKDDVHNLKQLLNKDFKYWKDFI